MCIRDSIDIAAAAQKHVDQAISLTLFMTSEATTRDLNKAYIYAFKKKIKTIYYVRIRQDVLKGSEHIDEADMRFGEAPAQSAAGSSRPKGFVCTGSSECEACML